MIPSQLGQVLPFFHKADGGSIKQERAPKQTGASGHPWQPDLQYYCMSCEKFVTPADVTDEKPKFDVKGNLIKQGAYASKPAAVPPPPAQPGAAIPPPKPIGG